jgi:hypothetical protein
MRYIAILLMLCLAGCGSVGTRAPERTMTPEEALGTYFLMAALTGKSQAPDFLAAVYPMRSLVVTFAVIGFHRDRGSWPTTEQDLIAYASSSPANPPLPSGAVAGFATRKREDGGIVYSTLEDRQRGREFTVSSTYKVTFPVPAYVFASPTSGTAPISRGSTISFDWGEAIAQAVSHIASMKK